MKRSIQVLRKTVKVGVGEKTNLVDLTSFFPPFPSCLDDEMKGIGGSMLSVVCTYNVHSVVVAIQRLGKVGHMETLVLRFSSRQPMSKVIYFLRQSNEK